MGAGPLHPKRHKPAQETPGHFLHDASNSPNREGADVHALFCHCAACVASSVQALSSFLLISSHVATSPSCWTALAACSRGVILRRSSLHGLRFCWARSSQAKCSVFSKHLSTSSIPCAMHGLARSHARCREILAGAGIVTWPLDAPLFREVNTMADLSKSRPLLPQSMACRYPHGCRQGRAWCSTNGSTARTLRSSHPTGRRKQRFSLTCGCVGAEEHWVCILDCAPQHVAVHFVVAVWDQLPLCHLIYLQRHTTLDNGYMRSWNTLKHISAQNFTRVVVIKTDDVGLHLYGGCRRCGCSQVGSWWASRRLAVHLCAGKERKDPAHQAYKQHEEGRLVSAVLPEEDDADDCDYLDVHDGQQSLRLSGHSNSAHRRRWDTSWPCGWRMAPRAPVTSSKPEADV